MEDFIKEKARFIVSLTGFGTALHVNDILPDLYEIEDRARDSESNRIFAILRHLDIKHDAKEIMDTYKNWHGGATNSNK